MAVRGCVRVGCSGWNYKSWRGRFYPRDLPAHRWLEFYAQHFDTVEVNNTFYRLPERTTFAGWRTRMPSRFVAAIKASRFLTHLKRLRDPDEPLERLFSRASSLGAKLGPVLYQLPPQFACDLARLQRFLAALPRTLRARRLRHVMEFRHRSWYVPDVFRILEANRVALCVHDKAGSEIAGPFVGPFVYVRFHGTSGRYHGSYTATELDRWAARLAEAAQGGQQVFVYFNNDPDAVAVGNARTLLGAVSKRLESG